MCVVAAELRLLLLHAAAELCCVLYDVPHYNNIMPRKALLPNNISSILPYVLGWKSAHVLTLGKPIFHAGR